jgi:hypothetical protein
VKLVILLSGKAEHGKTATAERIIHRLNGQYKLVKIGFADPLKFIATKYFYWDGKKDMAGRQLLQQLGTNVIRESFPDYFAISGLNLVRAFSTLFDIAIFDDCRFENEVDTFSDGEIKTIKVRVTRVASKNGVLFENKLTPEQRQHPSETDLDQYPFDYYLTALDNEQALDKKVDKLIQWFLPLL